MMISSYVVTALPNLPPTAPIKASERKILKLQITQAFSLSEEDGNLLVPDLMRTFKFQTHTKEHGVRETERPVDGLLC